MPIHNGNLSLQDLCTFVADHVPVTITPESAEWREAPDPMGCKLSTAKGWACDYCLAYNLCPSKEKELANLAPEGVDIQIVAEPFTERPYDTHRWTIDTVRAYVKAHGVPADESDT